MDKCLITWDKATQKIIIYKWRFYLIAITMKKIEIPISDKGKFIFYKNYSLWWEFFDKLSNFFIQIPFLWWLLSILSFSFIFIYWLPITLLFDRMSWTNLLKRGFFILDNNNTIIQNINEINIEKKVSKDLIKSYFNIRKRNYILYITLWCILILLAIYFDKNH